MVQKRVVFLEDDIDGSKASETVRFGLDGFEYEIDVNDNHAIELREALARYVKAGRKVTGGGRGKSLRKAIGNDSKVIRTWANSQGIQVNSRGRIQADVIEQYNAAHTSASV
jgi:hypothetical protein